MTATNQKSQPSSVQSRPGCRRRILFSSLAIVAGLLAIEGLCSLGWLLRDYSRFRQELPTTVQFREEFHTQHDPEIGWVNIPGKQIPDFYGPGRPITINADGCRALEDYVGNKPAGRFRLICLGDSFTLGYGVGDGETYPAQLESIHPRAQVVNMGQGGFSIGQCYLWYLRDGDHLDADGLVFAFILDDIWRMGEGRLANGAAAPGFEIRNGELHVTGQPLPPPIATGKPLVDDGQTLEFFINHSAIMRSVHGVVGTVRDSDDQFGRQEKFQIALRIIDELQGHAASRSVPLRIVLLPELDELTDPGAAETYRIASEVLRSFTFDRNVPFLDLYDTFAASGPAAAESYYLQEHWNHYNEHGNQLVARQLHTFLVETLPDYASGSGPVSPNP